MKNQVTRRELLRNASLAGGLAALGGVWSDKAAAISRSPNEKLNVACIGCGGMGAGDAGQMAGENIVALCDVDDERAAETFNKNPQAKKFKDYRKMLDEMGKSIDACTVSTPDHHHAPAACYAMKMGKHVYVQKPMAHSVSEARIMMETARKHKVVTQMGTQGHAFPSNIRAVELIQGGALGNVTEVHVITDRPAGWWPQGVDAPSTNDPVPTTLDWEQWLGPCFDRAYNKAYLPFVWRGWWDFGTGALGDMACHLMDVAFWSLNLKYVDWVEAQGDPIKPYSAPLWSVIKYHFAARAKQPAVTLTWYDGGKRPSGDVLDRPLKSDWNGSIFIGDRGKMILPHGEPHILLPESQYAGFKGPDPTIPIPENHWKQWINACKGNGKTGSHFDYAAPMTESILLGNVALRTGRRVEYDWKALKANGSPEADQYIHHNYRSGWSL